MREYIARIGVEERVCGRFDVGDHNICEEEQCIIASCISIRKVSCVVKNGLNLEEGERIHTYNERIWRYNN